jgi:ATP-dependent Lon protease
MRHSFPTLYLFNNIFFPQTVIPLTVSDTISKDVLKKCFDDNSHIALYHPSARSKRVGTIGKILMLEFNDDGSVSALVQGLVRIKFMQQEQHLPYPVYQVEDYFDHEDKASILDDSIERLHKILENWLNRHISSSKERERFMKEMNTPHKLINNLCLLVLKDVELKEVFLECTSLADRIRMMDAVLRGQSPEIEDMEMCEAIKNFERLEPHDYDLKNVV